MLQFWLIANTVLSPFSVKLGGLTLGLNTVLLLFAGAMWLVRDPKIRLKTATVICFICFYFIYSSVLVLTSPCGDHALKSIMTMPILLFLVLIGVELGLRASIADWEKLQKTAQWCLALAFVAFGVEMLTPGLFPLQASYRSDGKLSGLFSEPSHVAIALFPCIAILLIADNKKTRRRGMLALLALLILSRSSTLLALILAWVVYRLLVKKNYRQTLLVTLGIALLVALAAISNFERFILPVTERVVGVASSSETTNVSSLVYLQGWQDAWANLQQTHGMGLGVNMMGCGTLPDVPARRVLELTKLGELNAEDGSFLFAKIVSEGGVTGIAASILAIWGWFHLEKKLRHLSKNAGASVAATQTTLIFCFLISCFVRSAGYFDGGLLIWTTAASAASKWLQSSSSAPAILHVFTSNSDQPDLTK